MQQSQDALTMREISWQKIVVSAFMSSPFLLKAFQRKTIPNIVEKILVVQWDCLGDIITSTPALKALRIIYPDADIELLTSCRNASYLEGFPYVSSIVFIENPLHAGRSIDKPSFYFDHIRHLRQKEYDIIVELTGRLPNQIFLPFLKTKFAIGLDPAGTFFYLDKQVTTSHGHQIERDLNIIRLIGELKGKNFSLWNPVTEKDRSSTDGLMEKFGISVNNYAIIHPTSSWKPKRWDARRWARVADAMMESNKRAVFIGIGEEQEHIKIIMDMMEYKDAISLVGNLNIRQVAALMEKAGLFIGNDSGPMHLAAAVGLKGVVLFGPGNPERWGYPEIHTIIHKKPECGPCPQFAFRDRCSKGFEVCKGLDDIPYDEVIEACKKYV